VADLSPAAQAIWDAFNDVAERVGTFDDYGDALAAALRAAADQVVEDEPDYMRYAVPSTDWWDKHDQVRSELLSLANELDPTP
jgi:hypothetical protein